jgi:hypothetical protein
VLDARAIDVLRDIFAEVCAHAQATRVEMDGEDDTRELAHSQQLCCRRYPPPLKDGVCRAFRSTMDVCQLSFCGLLALSPFSTASTSTSFGCVAELGGAAGAALGGFG